MALGTSRATSKGQITIPITVREALGIEPGDVVMITLDGCGRAILQPQKGWAERTAGIFKAYAPDPPLSREELEEAIDNAWVDAAAERDQRSKQAY